MRLPLAAINHTVMNRRLMPASMPAGLLVYIYGVVETMASSFNHTRAFIDTLDTNPPGIEHGLGDWMPAEPTSVAFTGLGFQRTAYLAFANISSLLGLPDVASKYRTKARMLAEQLNARFLDETSGAYLANPAHNASTQAAQGMALFQSLCPSAEVCARALKVLATNARAAEGMPGACQAAPSWAGCSGALGGKGAHLTAGLFGVKWVLMSLGDNHLNDLALEMLLQETFPSFGWMMSNDFANATTVWESWFFSDDVFSHNHPMFGSSEVWLIQSLLGIQPHPAAFGMDRLLIKPAPPAAIAHVAGSFATPRGTVNVSWAWQRGSGGDGGCIGGFSLNLTVPPNVRATVHVPASSHNDVLREHGGHAALPVAQLASARWVGGGGGVAEGAALPAGRGSWVMDVGSGTYCFTVEHAAAWSGSGSSSRCTAPELRTLN
jgi:hypothetical protein